MPTDAMSRWREQARHSFGIKEMGTRKAPIRLGRTLLPDAVLAAVAGGPGAAWTTANAETKF